MRTREHSCNTTVSEEGEEDEDREDLQQYTSSRSKARRKPALPMSDDDDDGDHGGESAEKESDADYLKRFRESRAARLVAAEQDVTAGVPFPSSSLSSAPSLMSADTVPKESRSTMLSSTHSLAEESSSDEDDNQARANSPSQASPSPQKRDLKLSASFAPTPNATPYVTEAEKQTENISRKNLREERTSALVMRKARAMESPVDQGHFEEVVEEDIDTSDIEIQQNNDNDDLPSALEAAKTASHKRRMAEDRKRAQEDAQKVSNRGKTSRGGVLEMRVEEESDSDLDFNKPEAADSGDIIKPLGRKELEQMHRTQARIERESKTRLAKSLRNRAEKPVFGINDLLSSFDTQERSHGAAKERDDASNSDPIESASDNDRAQDMSLAAQVTSWRSDRFTPILKDLSPMQRQESLPMLDEEDLPDPNDVATKFRRKDEQKRRLEALKERKMQVLLRAAEIRKDAMSDSEEDDLLSIEVPTKKAVKPDQIPRRARPIKANNIGSPNTSTEDDSDNELVSIGQLQRAGKVLQKGFTTSSYTERQVAESKSVVKSPKKKERHALSKAELDALLVRKLQIQNIEMRKKRQLAFGKKREGDSEKDVVPAEDVAEMVRRLREAHDKGSKHEHDVSENDADDAEYRPDEDINEPEFDLGSAEEDFGDGEDVEGKAHNDSDSDSVTEDSEKENSAPASQESLQPKMPRRTRALILDEDEDEDERREKGETASALIRIPSQDRSPLQPITIPCEGDVDTESQIRGSSVGVGEPAAFDAGLSQFFKDTQLAEESAPLQISSSPVRNISSTLGKFFEDTQTNEPLRGESFSVLGNEFDESAGFSQFFNEDGTQTPAQGMNRLMLPPSTSAKGLSLLGGTDQDEFAALRKAQASEACALDTDVGPSLEDLGGLRKDDLVALEMEALQAEFEERQSSDAEKHKEADVTYINVDGFFTQTRPDFERYSLSQSQSQSQSDRNRWQGQPPQISESVELQDKDGEPVVGKKRFRRAFSPAGEEEEEVAQLGAAVRGRDIAQKTVETIPPSPDQQDGAGATTVPVQEDVRQPRNAFDLLKEKPRNIFKPLAQKEKNRFVEGEAEESDDEDEESGPGRRNRAAGRGGLGGVFSDDEADSGEDEEDDEDDDQLLEDLVDESKEEDEAEKDLLAHERYRKDIDADDEAALALHEKAARGGLRNKRRALNLDGTIEGFLDDDYEDEWLERKVKNPYGNVSKKRRLDGRDGLDLLEANEETQAFVRKYKETHEKETELEKYSFLIPAEGEGGVRKRNNDQDNDDEDSHDDEQLSDAVEMMTHQQLRQELEERRKRKKRQAVTLSDDDDDVQNVAEAEEAKRSEQEGMTEEDRMMKRIQRDIYRIDSDEDDDEEADVLERQAVTHRLMQNQAVEGRDAMLDDEEDSEQAFSALNQMAKVRSLTEREKERLARLQSEYANEPEWGNQDAHQSNRRNTSSTGGSVTSFGSHRSSSATTKKPGTGLRATSGTAGGGIVHPHRVRSKLNSVLSRQNLFSESLEE